MKLKASLKTFLKVTVLFCEYLEVILLSEPFLLRFRLSQ